MEEAMLLVLRMQMDCQRLALALDDYDGENAAYCQRVVECTDAWLAGLRDELREAMREKASKATS